MAFDFSINGFDLLYRGVQYGAPVEETPSGPPPEDCFLLQADGFYILQADGFRIAIDCPAPPAFLLQEDNDFLLQEDSFKIEL